MSPDIELSLIIPVTERFDDVQAVYRAYKQAAVQTGLPFEIVYVLDGDYPEVAAALNRLNDEGEHIRVIKLARWFGEATALSIGFEHTTGNIILTLPAYLQIDPAAIPDIIGAMQDNDMVVTRRWPRRDSGINRLQSSLFNWATRKLTGAEFRDLGCGVRVIRRSVIEDISLYGDNHRFLPLLAHRQGFKTREIDAPQASADETQRIYRPGVYLRRLLDLLSIFFLLKFTKKPLRFFGLLGSGVFALGVATALYLTIDRMFFGTAMGDRPLLLLATLFIVLGIQIFAIGLIGEIIIFTHAKDIKEYTIEEIVN